MRFRASFLLGLGFALASVACGDDDPSGTGGAGGGGGAGSTTASGDTSSTTGAAGGGDGGGGDGGGGTGGAGGGEGGAGGGEGGAGGGAGGGGGGDDVWHAPACDQVTGDGDAVTFTTDQGDTVTPRDGAMSGVAYTWGLVALDTPNTLLAAHEGVLLRSTDAGCSWKDDGALPGTLTRLIAAPGGRAYGLDEGQGLAVRIDAAGGVTTLTLPFQGTIRGLGVAPDDADHVRVADDTGAVWDSTDAGATWQQVGDPAPRQCFYTVAFDPNDLDHAICGTITYGTFVTFDGGASWQESEGDALYAQTFTAVVSPADANVVWAIGHENGMHDGEVIGEDLKHLWRSTDGGLTFESILDERSEATGDGELVDLINGNPLFAHPTDPEVAYYTFGMPPLQSANFAELFRVDASDGTVTVEAHVGGDIDAYDALAFHPTDPSIIYLGLTSERPGGL